MTDNKTPFSSKKYDEKIEKQMPFYKHFHSATIDLVTIINENPHKWLDTGCATGSFVQKAQQRFKDTTFFLADPSKAMLEIAAKVSDNLFENGTGKLCFEPNYFDVITAILSHHYLNREQRHIATENCFNMLTNGGIYITFENIKPLTPFGESVSMQRWFAYKQANDSSANENEHYSRVNKEYHPITILEHIDLLKKTGFKTVEMFWMSYMQAGFYAIK